jgi:hypothetical protein
VSVIYIKPIIIEANKRRLGTLQTCILETESSKDELVSTIGERALSDGQADLVSRGCLVIGVLKLTL